MIIQNTSLTNQAQAPDVRHSGVEVTRAAVRTPAAVPAVEVRPAPEQVQKAVNTINKAMQQASQGLQFSIDPDTHEPIVKMVDTSTGEVIRQIPSEEMVAISRAIDRFQQGLLLREKA